MINQVIINNLRKNGDVCFMPYSAPFGYIYILGNDISLKALIFKNSYPGSAAIEKHFGKGKPDSIRKSIFILDKYFAESGHNRKAKTDRHVVKTEVNDQSLMITNNAISLLLDLSDFTRKEITVYRQLLKISAGTTISYGHLADRADIPGGARFVGNAMAKNHFPIMIPCHRVIKSDGSIGNYSGGIHIKKYLLDLEYK